MAEQVPIGRCIGCRHDFLTGPCGGCGAIAGPEEQCPGDCEDGDCAKCGSRYPELWCDDCRFYAAQDAEPIGGSVDV
jgi:hypothetical protein